MQSATQEELTVARVGEEVMAIMADAPYGDPLSLVDEALIALATRSCGTTLDLTGTREHLELALDAGVTAEQVQEMLVLVAGIGIHGLIATSSIVADTLREREHPAMGEFDAAQEALWASIGGGDEREARIAAVAPDFLPNLVRLSPEPTVRALLDFRAAPWFGTTLTPLQKELIGIAVDSMPSHRFLPTLRVHVRRAKELGVGQRAVQRVLEIAAATPDHRGVW